MPTTRKDVGLTSRRGSSAVVDYEELLDTSFNDLNQSYQTNVMPRWERKKLQAQQQKHQKLPQTNASSGGITVPPNTISSGITGPRIPFGKTTLLNTTNTSNTGVVISGDRFIPCRSNIELAKHQMMQRQNSTSKATDNSSAHLSSSMQSSQLSFANENIATNPNDGSNNNSNTNSNNNESSNSTSSDSSSSLSSQQHQTLAVATDKKDQYASSLSSALLGVEDMSNSRILSYSEKAPVPSNDTIGSLNVLYSSSASAAQKKFSTKLVNRYIPSGPSRILDAPDLMDDYYLNLISWNDMNILAVALGQTVYLWNASTSQIDELCTFDTGINPYISSVSWVQQGGTHLAVGVSTGATQLWDVQQMKQVRSMDGHTDRVSCLSWNRHLLSSGSRDTNIVHHDVRIAQHNIACLNTHTQEVCGLAWSPDGETLASGGNDNLLCLWNAALSSSSSSTSSSSSMIRPRFIKTEHQAAVKAIAWSPFERTLVATGAGTADRTIKFWNTTTGSLLNSIDTGSQVCSLLWNPYEKNEILSSHGYSRNQITLWKYPSMNKIKEFDGHHTSRVLHMACSPIDGTVLSAAADETLRFWDIFAAQASTSSTTGTTNSSTSVIKKATAPNGSGHTKSSSSSWTMQIR